MEALILGAGSGSRLMPLTKDKPKCMVRIGSETILDRQARTFQRCGITSVNVVVGHFGETVPRYFKIVSNHNYKNSNMVESMFCAAHLFSGKNDIIVSYGDLIYKDDVLKSLIKSSGEIAVAVDIAYREYWEARMANPLDDLETLKLDSAGNITEIGKKPKSYADINAQYMGLLKIKKTLAKKILKEWLSVPADGINHSPTKKNFYMTDFLQLLIDKKYKIKAVPVANNWLEIDTISDIQLYGSKFFPLD